MCEGLIASLQNVNVPKHFGFLFETDNDCIIPLVIEGKELASPNHAIFHFKRTLIYSPRDRGVAIGRGEIRILTQYQYSL